MRNEPRRPAHVGIVISVLLLSLLAVGCGALCMGDPDCPGGSPADVQVRVPSRLVDVQLTGVCAGETVNTGSSGSYDIRLASIVGGDCHFVLTFADGFIATGDVEFNGHSTACGCHTATPSGPPVVVTEPSSGTTDDGATDAGAADH